MPALIVMMLAGSSWQGDAHMLFFAELAVTAALLDRQAVIVGALVIAAHHLALNLILPALVFPGGADVTRVVFHAVVVALECAALAWLVDQAAKALSEAEASAVEIFELAKIREDEQKRAITESAAAQQATLNQTADAFEVKVGSLVSTLSSGVTELQATAQSMSATATKTNQQATTVAAAAEEAGAGVQTVAAAAEELTASIHEISRQVAQSAKITGEAVDDARQTDVTVRTLADTAHISTIRPEELIKALEGGAIYQHWQAIGGMTSPLGAPTSPELDAEGGARYATFAKGAMYWSATAGTQPVTGAIYDAWASQSYERGPLGLPTSAEIQEPLQITQNFQHGTLNFERLTGNITAVVDGITTPLSTEPPSGPNIPPEHFSLPAHPPN